jgi:phosphomannomutase
MNKFLFDVDGTLTPSRQQIDPEFRNWFIDFCDSNDVYLVTGSDYPKTVEQVGIEICMSVKRIYNCCGNDVWEQGNNVKTSKWKIPLELKELLKEELKKSKFPLRTGTHIEERPGLCNFSIVGRECTLGERMMYIKWDQQHQERKYLADLVNSNFKEITAELGGQTGIDIFEYGKDKGQVAKDFLESDNIYFFGDRMEPGGNDLPLAKKLKKESVYKVDSWKDTLRHLKGIINEN